MNVEGEGGAEKPAAKPSAKPGAKPKAGGKAGGKASAGLTAGGKVRKARRVKDPNRPKRGANPYAFFLQAVRPKVVEEHPSMGFGDVGKEVARRWKLLTPEAKAPYVQQSADDKTRAAQAAEAYVAPDPAVLKARQTATHNVMLSLSPALRQLLGAPENMSRFDVMRDIHAYFKDQGLKDPQDKRFVLANEPLKQLFGLDRFLAISVTKLLQPHVQSTGGPVQPRTGAAAPQEEDEEEEEEEEDEEEDETETEPAATPAAGGAGPAAVEESDSDSSDSSDDDSSSSSSSSEEE